MDIDVTYLFQFGIVLLLLVTLNGLILKPFLRVIEERERRTTGAEAEVELLTKAGDESRAHYQVRMREAKVQAQKQRDALKDEGRERERQLLAAARADIADALNKTRAEVSNAEGQARVVLKGDADGTARSVVQKVLGREVHA